MSYYINLFSPETYMAFSSSSRDVTGFRERQKSIASSIKIGDKLICYMTKLSRWIGVFEVTSKYFIDDKPIFMQPADPFCVRFNVIPRAWLSPEHSIPISHDVSWKHLSFTKDVHRNSSSWTAVVRGSLRKLSDEDGEYLESLLISQKTLPREYRLTEADKKKLVPSLINSESGQIAVSIPDDDPSNTGGRTQELGHIEMQAKIAEIGEQMGFKIWVPSSDRQRVLELWHPSSDNILLSHLPLNYDNVTLRIIENIDVLWIRRNAIIHAFEIEHTTAIYSGLLRMADLMTLQPNLKIKTHIVAPVGRRAKVLREISRPVFALMESGPMSESCSYLSYDSIIALSCERNLHHLNDSVLEEYVEYAQDADF